MPQRPDDPSIGDEERLWRRVHPKQIDLSSETGEPEVSSGAFSTREELSIAISSQTTLETFVFNYPEHSVVEFTAGAARVLGCSVVRDPLPNDPAHALLCGPRSRGRLTQSQKELLKQVSRLILFKSPERND